MNSSEITVAEYLLTRLKGIGVDHLFGVTGGPRRPVYGKVKSARLMRAGTLFRNWRNGRNEID